MTQMAVMNLLEDLVAPYRHARVNSPCQLLPKALDVYLIF